VNAKQFPLITLKRKSVKKVSNRQYTVFGDLTFLGATKPVTVQANITGQGKRPQGEVRTGAEAHCTVKRSEQCEVRFAGRWETMQNSV
jgi:polyisoprenoid-binding protein YceI